jgi:hypothetical protein
LLAPIVVALAADLGLETKVEQHVLANAIALVLLDIDDDDKDEEGGGGPNSSGAA